MSNRLLSRQWRSRLDPGLELSSEGAFAFVGEAEVDSAGLQASPRVVLAEFQDHVALLKHGRLGGVGTLLKNTQLEMRLGSAGLAADGQPAPGELFVLHQGKGDFQLCFGEESASLLQA